MKEISKKFQINNESSLEQIEKITKREEDFSLSDHLEIQKKISENQYFTGMNVFKKLQTVVGKKEKSYSAFDEIIGKDRNIELGDIDKLKVGDLVDIVKKYD